LTIKFLDSNLKLTVHFSEGDNHETVFLNNVLGGNYWLDYSWHLFDSLLSTCLYLSFSISWLLFWLSQALSPRVILDHWLWISLANNHPRLPPKPVDERMLFCRLFTPLRSSLRSWFQETKNPKVLDFGVLKFINF